MTLGIITGLVAGLLIGWLIIFLASPKLMFKESRSPLSFDDTVAKIEELVAGAGWKIPAMHDLQATMKKFDHEVRSVKVIEICQPDYAYKILRENRERIVSNMMPCRLSVYEKEDGSVWISRMNSGVVSKPMGKLVRQTMTVAAKDMEVVIAEVTGE